MQPRALPAHGVVCLSRRGHQPQPQGCSDTQRGDGDTNEHHEDLFSVLLHRIWFVMFPRNKKSLLRYATF
jgi:hypothetical protein